MPLYTQSIKNLKGGISQQPDILRFSDQGEEQVNAWSSESEGLQKKPPSVFIKRLDSQGFSPTPKFHLINRDEEEQYYIVFNGSGIRVFELDGTEKTVNGSMTYVTTSSPREDLRVVTVADYTFIVNRKRTVTKGTTISNAGYKLKGRAIINVRGGQYGKVLKVGFNGLAQIQYTLPNGSNASEDPPKIDAQHIAKTLRDSLAGATQYAGWTFTVGSGFVLAEAPSGTNINTVETEDGYANQLITGIIDEVQTVSKLPLAGPNGYIIKIAGETGSNADEYYVRYDTGSKTWKETVAPGVVIDFNADSMPHALVRQSNGTFSFQTLSWATRGAGNDDTNPFPSFVDNKINDVFFYRNRLGFLSGENIIMSRPGGYFRFFPKSVATISDDDPIDVAVSHPRISILKYAVPFAEQLLLWSDEVQFVLTSAGTMTAKSIQLDVASAFSLSDEARPFTVGRSVFFSAPRGSYTSIKRYFAVADVSDVKDADDVTGHVLSYINNGVFDIQGTGTESFLTVLTTGAKRRIYIYKFLFSEGQQLQASWSHWEFDSDVEVLAASCIGSSVYLVKRTPNAIDLERIDFIKESTDFADEPYRLHIDSKVEYTVPADAYDDYQYTSTFKLSDAYGGFPTKGDYYVVTTKGDSALVTEPATGWVADSTITLKGDWSGQKVFIGRRYKMRYAASRFLIKQEDQGGTQTVDTGRLQLRRAWVNYENTGALRAMVTTPQQTFINTLNGAPIGELVIGKSLIGDGQYRFPMNGDAMHTRLILESDYPTPVSIVGCGWEASYARKAKSI